MPRVLTPEESLLFNSGEQPQKQQTFGRVLTPKESAEFRSAYPDQSQPPQSGNPFAGITQLSPVETFKGGMYDRTASSLRGAAVVADSLGMDSKDLWNESYKAEGIAKTYKAQNQAPEGAGFITQGIHGVSESILPGMATAFVRGGLPTAVGGAVAGGALGLAGGGVGAVPGAVGGAVGGFGLGTGADFYKQGVGDIYNRIIEAGIDEPTARTMSIVGGVPYAALEKLQLKVLASPIKQLAGKGGQKALQALMQKSPDLALIVGRGLAKYAGAVGIETGTEALQRGVEEGAVAASQYASGDTPAAGMTLQNLPGAMIEEAREVLPSMAVLPAPGAAVNTAVTARRVGLTKKGLAEISGDTIEQRLNRIKEETGWTVKPTGVGDRTTHAVGGRDITGWRMTNGKRTLLITPQDDLVSVDGHEQQHLESVLQDPTHPEFHEQADTALQSGNIEAIVNTSKELVAAGVRPTGWSISLQDGNPHNLMGIVQLAEAGPADNVDHELAHVALKFFLSDGEYNRLKSQFRNEDGTINEESFVQRYLQVNGIRRAFETGLAKHGTWIDKLFHKAGQELRDFGGKMLGESTEQIMERLHTSGQAWRQGVITTPDQQRARNAASDVNFLQKPQQPTLSEDIMQARMEDVSPEAGAIVQPSDMGIEPMSSPEEIQALQQAAQARAQQDITQRTQQVSPWESIYADLVRQGVDEESAIIQEQERAAAATDQEIGMVQPEPVPQEADLKSVTQEVTQNRSTSVIEQTGKQMEQFENRAPITPMTTDDILAGKRAEVQQDNMQGRVVPATEAGYRGPAAKGKFAVPGGPMADTVEAAAQAYLEIEASRAEHKNEVDLWNELSPKILDGSYTESDLKKITRFGKAQTVASEMEGILVRLGLRPVDAKRSVKGTPETGATREGYPLYDVAQTIETARNKGFLGNNPESNPWETETLHSRLPSMKRAELVQEAKRLGLPAKGSNESLRKSIHSAVPVEWFDYKNMSDKEIREQATERGVETKRRKRDEIIADLQSFNERGIGAEEIIDTSSSTLEAFKSDVKRGKIRLLKDHRDTERKKWGKAGFKNEDMGPLNAKGLPQGLTGWFSNEAHNTPDILLDMAIEQNFLDKSATYEDLFNLLRSPHKTSEKWSVSLEDWLESKKPKSTEITDEDASFNPEDYEIDEDEITFSTADVNAEKDLLMKRAGGDPYRAWTIYEQMLATAANRGEPVDPRYANTMREALLGKQEQADLFGEASPEKERRSTFKTPADRPVQQSLDGIDDGLLFSTVQEAHDRWYALERQGRIDSAKRQNEFDKKHNLSEGTATADDYQKAYIPKRLSKTAVYDYLSKAWPDVVAQYKTKKALLDSIEQMNKRASGERKVEYASRGASSGTAQLGIRYDAWPIEDVDNWAAEQIGNKEGDQGLLFSTAHHGTPHTFEPEPEAGFPHGRFRLDKIGTGEGAQAYGHGIYFADREEVGKSYMRSPGEQFTLYGERQNLTGRGFLEKPKSERRALSALSDFQGNFIEAEKALRESFDPISIESANLIKKWVSEDAIKPYNEGNLYQVDIPDDAIPKLLDWDKTYEEQTEYVRRRLDEGGKGIYVGRTGKQIYDEILYEQGGYDAKQISASEYLAKLGIPGNRYLDGDSRGKGEGSYNYVIWDQGLLDRIALLERNGDRLDQMQKDVKFSTNTNEYQGLHTPPNKENGAPLYDLTGGGNVYPDDIYSANGQRYYGTGDDISDRESMNIIQRMRNNPNGKVRVYRAVPNSKTSEQLINELSKQKQAFLRRGKAPKDSPFQDGSQWYDWASDEIDRLKKAPSEANEVIDSINRGDWVTVSRSYAKEHGEGALNGNYKLLSKTVSAKELFTNGDSINEFGYWPEGSDLKFSTADTAGLPDSASDRMKQVAAKEWQEKGTGSRFFRRWFGDSKITDENGEPLVVYHGTDKDFTEFIADKFNKVMQLGFGIHFSEDPEFVSQFYASDSKTKSVIGNEVESEILPLKGGNVMPVFLSIKNPLYADEVYAPGTPEHKLGLKLWPKAPFSKDGIYLQNAIDATSPQRASKLIQENGYDGVVYTAKVRAAQKWTGSGFSPILAGQSKSYVAFSPEQIKSATGNQGTFDPENPDIRFSTAASSGSNPYKQSAFMAASMYPDKEMYKAALTNQFGKNVEPYLDELHGQYIDERRKMVQRAQQAAQQQLDGLAPEGRPDLANIGTTPEAQRMVDNLDSARNQAGQPETRSDAVVEAEAMDYVEHDRNAAIAEIKAIGLAGEQLSDTQTVAAKMLYNDMFETAARTESLADIRAAAEFLDSYRETGTAQGRAMRQRRENNRIETVAEKKHALLEYAMLPSYKLQREIDAVKKRIKDKTLAQVDRNAARQKLAGLNMRLAKQVQNRIKSLKKTGWDLKKLDAVASDEKLLHAFMRDVSVDRSSMADKLHEFRLSMMLSAPPTHIVNVVSSQAHAVWEMTVQRAVEASINTVLGKKDAAQWGEFQHIFKAALNPNVWKQSIGNAVKAFSFETQVLTKQVTGADIFGPGALDSYKGVAIKGKKGRAMRVPLRALLFEDELQRTLFANMEAAGQAYRIAKGEGLKGKAMDARMAELVQDYNSDAWKRAMISATRHMFQDEAKGGTQEALMRVRNSAEVGRWMIPFARTPMSLFRAGIRKSVGAPVALALDIKRGEAGDVKVRHAAESVISVLGMYALYSLLLSGDDDDDDLPLITGSNPPGKRTSSWSQESYTIPPDSIRIGNQYYNYRRIEPFGSALSGLVTMLENFRDYKDGKGAAEAAIQGWGQFTSQFVEHPMLTGLNDTIDALKDPENKGKKFLQNFAGSFSPNLIKAVARAEDPLVRERRGMTLTEGARYSAMPDKSAAAPKVDVWGRNVTKGGSVTGRFLSPFRETKTIGNEIEDKLDSLIRKWNQANAGDRPYLPEGPGSSITHNKTTYTLTPSQWAVYRKKAGRYAIKMLSGKKLNYSSPSERDVNAVESALSAGQRRAKMEMLRALRQQ